MRTTTGRIDNIVGFLLLLLYICFTVSLFYQAPITEIADEKLLAKLHTNSKWVYIYLFGIMGLSSWAIGTRYKTKFVRCVVGIGEQISCLFIYFKWNDISLFEITTEQLWGFTITVIVALLSVLYMDKINDWIKKYIDKLCIFNKK